MTETVQFPETVARPEMVTRQAPRVASQSARERPSAAGPESVSERAWGRASAVVVAVSRLPSDPASAGEWGVPEDLGAEVLCSPVGGPIRRV